jgi:hypothetical protein
MEGFGKNKSTHVVAALFTSLTPSHTQGITHGVKVLTGDSSQKWDVCLSSKWIVPYHIARSSVMARKVHHEEMNKGGR